MNTSMRALSIRQPYVEQIFIGKKKAEYRSRPTNIRGKVYIYASKKGYSGDLPTGVIVGTVEIVGCIGDYYGNYQWLLSNPVRFKYPIAPLNHPQPAWFYPFK